LNATPTYEELRRRFAWTVPSRSNLGVLCADRHPPARLALIEIDEHGDRREHTFGDISSASNRLANALRHEVGIGLGDRMAIVLPQRVETALAHLATYKIGGIALPLSGLFGPDALRYRLSDSGARSVLTDLDHVELVKTLAEELSVSVICTDETPAADHVFCELVGRAAATMEPVAASPDTPTLLIYTSGTTGPPKGALHGQRVLHGHLPGFDLSHEFFPQSGDRFWTPADWAWIGGLMDALMPSWFHGRPVVATRQAKFDPEWAMELMARERIRNVFLPPTALKLMRQAGVERTDARLRTIGCGGEPLGDEILTWTRERFDVTINEFYGQTEANLLVGNCAPSWEVRPGSMGRPYPGHDVKVLAADGSTAPVGELGEIALHMPDPVAFLGYWGKPEATLAKRSEDGHWLLTGDLAREDDDGYLWYVSRNDDVINSGGYRIGPAEIEACLMRHAAVAMAAVVGVPDPVRGEVVKAYLVLAEGCAPTADLEVEIREFVKRRLAAYVYPRQIAFLPELPLTTTGKVRRAALRTWDAAGQAGQYD
jgi:acetyl-CoA synthetase